jgi:hypothetical protein
LAQDEEPGGTGGKAGGGRGLKPRAMATPLILKRAPIGNNECFPF